MQLISVIALIGLLATPAMAASPVTKTTDPLDPGVVRRCHAIKDGSSCTWSRMKHPHKET